MKKNSKRYKEIFKNKIKDKKINPKEALDLVKKNSIPFEFIIYAYKRPSDMDLKFSN